MISIKRAKLEDAGKITEIKIQAFNKEINTYLGRDGGPPGYDKLESESDIIKKHLAYKIMLENEIIGAFFLIQLEKTEMRFEDFVILPEYQGKGYGYNTMQLIERYYPLIEKWFLSTPIFSIGNQHLYEKFGYCEISRNDDEIEYCKRINK